MKIGQELYQCLKLKGKIMNDKAEMLFTDFKQAIQTACKAQRHACTRIYHKHYGNSEHYDECCELEIFTAEIERCDYE